MLILWLSLAVGAPGGCPSAAELAQAVESVFGVGVAPGDLALGDLAGLAPADLEALFAAAPPPAYPDVLGGEAVRTPLGPAAAAGALGFHATPTTADEACAGVWRASPAGDLLFKGFVVPSRFDGCPSLRLSYDYGPNDPGEQRRRDELRALNSELVLGLELTAADLDDEGLPLSTPAALGRFFALDLAAAGPYVEPAGAGWPFAGAAPLGGAPPAGWTRDFPVDPIEWPWPDRVVSLRHGDYHYIDAGSGERGTVLVVHGNPTWAFLYRKAIAELVADGYRVVAPSHFGYGLSEKLPASAFGYAPGDHADALEDLVQALELTGLTLVAQDWGVPLGLSLAGHLPSRVERLVVMNGWAWNLDPEAPGAYHRAIDWSTNNHADHDELVTSGEFPLGVALKLAGQNAPVGTPTWFAVRDAYMGPFLDTSTGQPLSEQLIEPTWQFAVEILTARDFLEDTWRNVAHLGGKPLTTLFGSNDGIFGNLLCDKSPWPACPPGADCVSNPLNDLCLASGAKLYPYIDRFRDTWVATAYAGTTVDEGVGHFSPEVLGEEIAADVRYLEHFAGPGCALGGEAPRLASTPAPLGGFVALSLERAAPGAAGWLFASPLPAGALAVPGGCSLYVDVLGYVGLGAVGAGVDGTWEGTYPVPSNPAFVGLTLAFQVLLVQPGGPLLGAFDASNGVHVVLQ